MPDIELVCDCANSAAQRPLVRPPADMERFLDLLGRTVLRYAEPQGLARLIGEGGMDLGGQPVGPRLRLAFDSTGLARRLAHFNG